MSLKSNNDEPRMNPLLDKDLPIGVFDSGVGGLTVLSAIQKALPHENLLYLGDTARLPYGAKSEETISRYVLQAADKLVSEKIKMLVLACNTATASALSAVEKEFPQIPIVGVIKPGASKACQVSKNGHIVVIGTEATIKKGAYKKNILNIRPEAQVISRACPLLVPLAEEGWNGEGSHEDVEAEGQIVQAIINRYLKDLFLNNEAGERPDCLVLGCTHFPHLQKLIAQVVGPDVLIVDSAETTADEVKKLLRDKNLARKSGLGKATFLTTDSPERFRKVGGRFLGQEIAAGDLKLVCL